MPPDPGPPRAAAQGWALSLSGARQGALGGSLLGGGAGSSLEFSDYRPYAAGDDPRRIDWAAYARTDEMMVRLHRDEIFPSASILIDTSGSMAPKRARAQEAASLLWHLARNAGARVTVWGGASVLPVEGMPDATVSLAFGGALRPDDAPALRMEGRVRSAVRIVVSDFLFPHDADSLVRRLGRNAQHLVLVGLLASAERDPETSGAVRLRDLETGIERDLIVGPEEVRSYRDRLERLETSLREACRRVRGAYVTLDERTPLPDVVRAWAREGIVEAA